MKLLNFLYLSLSLISTLLLVHQSVVLAKTTTELEVQFFYTKNCPYCIEEKVFLESIKEKYPQVKFNYYSVEDQENLNRLLNLYKKYNVPSFEQGAVPITFVGEDYFVGFNTEIGKRIEESIRKQLIKEPFQEPKPGRKIPLVDIDIEKYSLPALAVILGFVDGFNVCSLAAIILILSMVLALKSRKATLILGGVFILITGIIYGILILFWHQLFSLLTPWTQVMQTVTGMLVIGGGVYFVKEFFRLRKYGAVCPASKGRIHKKATQWLEKFFRKPKNLFLLVGAVVLFAAIITIVEFPCSAVVPLIFTGILAEAQLPLILVLSYTGLFLSFYMLDEIIVFLGAVFTMKIWLTSPKFLTWLHLFAAIVLFLLGVYYLGGLALVVGV